MFSSNSLILFAVHETRCHHLFTEQLLLVDSKCSQKLVALPPLRPVRTLVVP